MSENGSRRSLLVGLGGLAVGALTSGCRRCGEVAPAPLPPPRRSSQVFVPASSSVVAAPQGPTCAPTEPNIEGPYYRLGAPARSDLRGAGAEGVPLELGGSVLSLDCRSPLVGATVDLWHADAEGRYDNDGSRRLAPSTFLFRGVVTADATGAFLVRTIIPGRYLNGRTYRPAHIHAKVSAAGHAPLTTQLYFPGDPFNEGDPFLRESLLVDLEGDASQRRARFGFVLAPLS